MEFSKYKNLIYKQAHRYARFYNIDYRELVSEGYMIYLSTKEKYNSELGSFSTYLTHRLRMLNDYCRLQKKPIPIPLNFTNPCMIGKEQVEELKSLLSEDAKMIVNKLIKGDFHKINPIRQTKPSFYYISKKLKNLGWGISKIYYNWEEIKWKWNLINA